MTSSLPPVFVGCGFAAKYPEGGGNFSVPLQYLTGLKRMGRRGVWLEVLQESGDPEKDARCVRSFRRRMAFHGLEYCLLLRPPQGTEGPEEHHPEGMQVFGMPLKELRELAPHSFLLNLSYSIKPPLTSLFGRRLLCSLDPTEVLYWMDQMEMGQSCHDEFWSIGLCMDAIDPRLPKPIVPWKSYFPLVDTELLKPLPQPRPAGKPRFTTIGQWYWDGNIMIGGEWRDYSKQAAFAPYMDLPKRVPEAVFELAMNLNPDDPERRRLRLLGWKVATPHDLTRTPEAYYRYLAGATAEFTAVKLEAIMGSGWLSDRAAAFLALGRPVVTEPTGAERFLPKESGMLFVSNLEEAVEASRRVLKDWNQLSKAARSTAVEYFDSVRNLRLILGS
ncbi:MAG: hypothetical protein RLZZ408_1770 [Verrucomicrobiota bacterium]